MNRDEMKELVNLLGTTYSLTIFFQHKEELKTLEAYKMALDGVMRGNHSFELIRALTFNLITDFKRNKVKVDSYADMDNKANALRSSGFSLIDALDAWTELLLPKEHVDAFEKKDTVLYHLIHTILTCETVSDIMTDELVFADESLDNYIEEIGAIDRKAINKIGEGILDVIHILIPNAVSDTGDYGDAGQYMGDTFLHNTRDAMAIDGVPEDIKRWIYATYTDTLNAVDYFVKNGAPLIQRVEELACSFESLPLEGELTEEEQDTYDLVEDLYSDLKEVSKTYARTFYGTSEGDMILDDSIEAIERLTEAGQLIAAHVSKGIISPLSDSIHLVFPNAFDEAAVQSTLMSLIMAKLHLYDKLTHAVDGSMCVSYDGSLIDEEISQAVKSASDGDETIPVADVLSSPELAEGWVSNVFKLYDVINEVLMNHM